MANEHPVEILATKRGESDLKDHISSFRREKERERERKDGS